MKNNKVKSTKMKTQVKNFSTEHKLQLEQAATNALELYLMQENVLRKNKITKKELKLKEEALRYLLVIELSKIGIFGKFPSKNVDRLILIQHTYNTLKKGSKLQYPDIVSIGKEDGSYNYFLAVEIKNNGGKDNVKDLNKCFGYVDNSKGSVQYELALCINFSGKRIIKPSYISNRSQGNVLYTTVENYSSTNSQKIAHYWCKK
jgi:hypothetical protein